MLFYSLNNISRKKVFIFFIKKAPSVKKALNIQFSFFFRTAECRHRRRENRPYRR